MKIESKTVEVAASPQAVFEYLSDLNNFENLLPEGRISDWESRTDYCSFKVQGTATIDLQLIEAKSPNYLLLKSGDRSPFPLELNIHLTEHGAATSAFQIMNAEINPFLKMMVEKPLTNLFDYIADRLQAVFAQAQ